MKSQYVIDMMKNVSTEIKGASEKLAFNLLNLKTESSINYNANTLEEAIQYMNYRALQLQKFGYRVYEKMDVTNFGVVYYFIKDNDYNKKYVGIYLLSNQRGKGNYMRMYKEFGYMFPVITLEECNLLSYLQKHNIPCVYHQHDNIYKLIQEIYGDSRAQRSGVPYIYHIDEGLGYMVELGASQVSKEAYCLHPLFQGDEDFNKNLKAPFLKTINPEALLLAVEYRRVANSYLSKNNLEDFVGFTNDDIHAMLYADKMQNYKDFKLYHLGVHHRSVELENYFENWMVLLKNYKSHE